ncbi:MAG TPA: hypothetical protein VJA21_31045 [Verrucomicrobiae bacterium]
MGAPAQDPALNFFPAAEGFLECGLQGLFEGEAAVLVEAVAGNEQGEEFSFGDRWRAGEAVASGGGGRAAFVL